MTDGFVFPSPLCPNSTLAFRLYTFLATAWRFASFFFFFFFFLFFGCITLEADHDVLISCHYAWMGGSVL